MRAGRTRKHRIFLRLLAASLFCACQLGAQIPTRGDTASGPTRVIVGRVLDDAARGLPDVEVRAASGASALTDSSGRFALRGLPGGELTIVARKVGYDSTSANVPPAATGAASEVTLILVRAHRLREIVVEGKVYDRALWDRGFYHRQKVFSGTFFDTDAVEHFGGDGLGSLVRQAPRVDVRNIGNADDAFSRIAGRPGRRNVFIDGMFQRAAMPSPVRMMGGGAAEGVGLKDLIEFREIAAVELYPRASSVPIQFQRMGPPAGPQGTSSQQIGSPSGLSRRGPSQGENQDAACGAIVIWTKSPAAEQPTAPASAGG
jgi:hypothetical protein